MSEGSPARAIQTHQEKQQRKGQQDLHVCTKEWVSSSRVKVTAATTPRTAALFPTFFLRTGVPTSSPSHCSKLASVGSATAQLSVPENRVSHSSQSAQCSTFFSFWMTSVFRLCLQRKKSYYFCSKSSFFNVISITIRLDELNLLSILQILSISKMFSCPRQNPNSST